MIRVSCVAVALAAASFLGACATPSLDAEDAVTAAVEAFAAAGLDAGDPTGMTLETVDLAGDSASARSGEVWLMTIDVEGEEWTVGVDPHAGSIVRTFEPVGSEVSDAQVTALAEHRHNPAAERTSRVRRTVGVVVLVVLVVGGYLTLRALARRSDVAPSVVAIEPDD